METQNIGMSHSPDRVQRREWSPCYEQHTIYQCSQSSDFRVVKSNTESPAKSGWLWILALLR
jgi:hypothetical protein